MSDLSRNLLCALGDVTASWGHLEYEIKYQCYLCRRFTPDGKVIEGVELDNLETTFKELRRCWFHLMNEKFPEKAALIKDINDELCRLSNGRVRVTHRAWNDDGTVRVFRQKNNVMEVNIEWYSKMWLLDLPNEIDAARKEIKSLRPDADQ